MKNLKFNWDVSNLSDYVDQNSLDLISRAILADPTSKYVTIDADVKSAKDIHTIESDPLGVQEGTAGFSASGTTDIARVTLSVDKLKINQILDPYALESKFTQMALKPGSILDEVPFEQALSDEKSKQVSKTIALQVWQGNKTGAVGDYQLNDGFITDMALDGTRIQAANANAATWNETNIIAAVQAMIKALDPEVLGEDDLVMFMSPAFYRTLSNALFAGNYFHVNSDVTVAGEFMFPGTNVKIVRTFGLSNSNTHADATTAGDCVILGSAKFLHWGTDLLSDYSTFRLFYSSDNDDVRFIARYKIGVAHLFGSSFVTNF